MFDHATDPFRLNPDYRLQYEEAQECHVLLYPEGLVKLSATTAEILKRCGDPITGAELMADLQRKYPEADSLPDDVREFLDAARRQDWIVAVED